MSVCESEGGRDVFLNCLEKAERSSRQITLLTGQTPSDGSNKQLKPQMCTGMNREGAFPDTPRQGLLDLEYIPNQPLGWDSKISFLPVSNCMLTFLFCNPTC